jgi:hypothetical protein
VPHDLVRISSLRKLPLNNLHLISVILGSFKEMEMDSTFDDESPWPRRLLYVPTMTSLQWTKGKIYGGFTAPKYATVSYTWGRWEITDKEKRPDVKAINISGVDWDIPRIDPDDEEGFGVAEFETMIKCAVSSHPFMKDDTQLLFLWLDVACIHQSYRLEQDKEIGRQATIFRGATRSFVWLRHRNDDVQKWAKDMDAQFKIMISADFTKGIDYHEWFSQTKELVKYFVKDPWFTSLWTLQESFLCPAAIIIFRDGWKNEIDLCNLQMISDTLLSIKEAVQYHTVREWDRQYNLSGLIDKTGFLDGVRGNLMALLTASHSRFAKKELDHVYGIMQVFNCKVGKSTDNSSEVRPYSIEELEDQLGAEILLRYPALSQLHVHESPVEVGRSWRFSHSSIVPELLRPFVAGSGENTRTSILVTFSVHEAHTRVILGAFEGLITPFSIFAKRLFAEWPNSFQTGSTRTILDKQVPLVSPANDESLVPNYTSDSITQAIWLLKQSPQTKLLLVALSCGHRDSGEENKPWKWALGLLIRPAPTHFARTIEIDQNNIWVRQGILIWNVEDERLSAEASELPILAALRQDLEEIKGQDTKRLPFLIGDDDMWEVQRGILG